MNIDTELQKVRAFFEACRSGDDAQKPCYFKMSSIRRVEQNSKMPSKAFYKNYNTTDIEDSLAKVEEAISMFGENEQQYIMISLQTDPKSNHDHIVTINNPYFVNRQNSSIAGLPQQQQAQQQHYGSLLLEMQKTSLESKHKLEMQLMEMKHERALEKAEEALEAAEYAKRGKMEAITGFAETETGQKLLSMVIGMLTAANAAAPQQVAPQQVITPQPQDIPHQQADEQPNQDAALASAETRLAAAFEELSKIDPDVVALVERAATMAKQNPEMVRTVLGKQ